MNSDTLILKDFLSIGGADVFEKATYFAEYLDDMRTKRFDTYRSPMTGPATDRVTMGRTYFGDSCEMLMLGSNNYLGLTTHPRVVNACHSALDKYGSASGGPALLGGFYDVHVELEKKLAALKGHEDAILFPSGYAANMGAVSALVGPGQTAVLDQNCHASIIDGAAMSKGKIHFFRHNDAAHLDHILRKCKAKQNGALVVVDGVYSVSGRLADLPNLLPVIRSHGARILVDDAHATGVVGPKGRGTASIFDMEQETDLSMGTLSKALAGIGGFVTGPRLVIDYLRFYSRSQFFSTTIPPVATAAVIEAMDIINEEPEILAKLWSNTDYLREGLTERGFDLGGTKAPILPIVVGDELTLRRINRDLFANGIYASAIPYPAVAKNQARIRFSVNAKLSTDDLDKVIDTMTDIGRKHGVLPKSEKLVAANQLT